MGHMIQLNDTYIKKQIYRTAIEIKSPYNDGFIAWAYKKQLYELKWAIEGVLNQSPNFSQLEDEFIKQHEHGIIVNILKR
jgi:hypothetical protein